MADTKITGLNELTAPADEDLLAIVDDPSGSEETKKITRGNLLVGLSDGWIPITGTFSYASSTTITISAGGASKYSKGDKLRFQNNDSGTYLYVYVITVADTLLTVIGDTVPNATLTDAYYSKIENPQGFPHSFSWTPTPAGYSVNPTNTMYRFRISGSKVKLTIREGTSGTSNSTGTTYTLPVTAKTVTNGYWCGVSMSLDNGSVLTPAGLLLIGSAGTTLAAYTNWAQAGWTASGGKRIVVGEIEYEI